MKYRTLGRTGLRVSVIGLGTHQFSGEWARQFSQGDVSQILERASELGINLIDTAECYGDHSVEKLIGQSIRNNRGDWIIGTKFGHRYDESGEKLDAWSADEVLQQLEQSLRALGTDYIDLYQFHSGSNQVFNDEKLWSILSDQVQAGKVRHLGISLGAELMKQKDLQQLYSALKVNAGFVQIIYNRLFAEAEMEVLPYCRKHDLGVLARVPLAKGFLSGVYQPGTKFVSDDIRSRYNQTFNDEQLVLVDRIKREEVPPGQNMAQWALSWCLKNTAVSAVVVGCKSLEQLELNAAAASDVATV
jgi:myo-inositol catabolism protein IolS